MVVLFAFSWFTLVTIVHSLSEDTLQRIKLVKSSTIDMQKYWYVKYDSNSYISCSFVKICDDCERKTKSIVVDYNLDLTEKKSLGIDAWNFDGDEKLRTIYLSGKGRHSFIRAIYRAGDYDLTRVDDTGADIVKVTGELIQVSADILRHSGICEDEKLANKMLKKFKLSPQNIKQLIEYMHQTDDSDFAKEILRRHNIIKLHQTDNLNFSSVSRSELSDEISETNSESKQTLKEKNVDEDKYS